MSVLLLASALLMPLRAPLALTLDVKDGETVRGERTIKVSVFNANTAVNQVEFYVNGELRDTDTSTPYEFRLDTVGQPDGPVKLRFKAYTVESQTAEKSIVLKVDNELAKGAAYHVGKANELLTDGKFKEARDEGKIALKIEKGNPEARLALARAYSGLGELDQAQLQAEEAKATNPKDTTALNLLAGINARRAFTIYAKPDADRAETLKSIKDALTSAVDNRKTALDLEFDAMTLDPANPLPYADAALRAHRYSAAIAALSDAVLKDPKNSPYADRLAYAYLRTSRRQDAINALNANQRAAGTLDAYGYALRGVALAAMGDDAGSDAAIREAVLADSENLGVRTAQAYITLKRGKTDVLARLNADLRREQGQRADVRYFQMAVATKAQEYNDAAKAFQVGVLAEPAMADLYVEYANDAIALTQRSNMDPKEKDRHYAEARAYFEIALAARPEASEALSGLAMVAAFENKPAEAVRYATAATSASPTDPGAYYALAAAQSASATSLRRADPRGAGLAQAAAQAANLKAGRLDPKYLGGREIPDAAAVWRYLGASGRPVVIAAP